MNNIYYISEPNYIPNNITNLDDGFKKGNIFKSIYSLYDKYTYNFVAKNERQKMLLEIMKNSFYAHDLNLYLDNNPNDIEMIKLFNNFNSKTELLINEYNKMYEPINLTNIKEIPTEWVESPWPWEGV